MFEELKGKVVVITGATSGIGYASAKKFAELGAKIFITGRNEEVLKELNDELNSKTESGFISGDLSDQKFREILIENTINKFSGLDVLVNSAGIIGSGSIENTPMEEYDRMIILSMRAGQSFDYLNIVWHIGNIGNALMAFPNLVGLLFLAGTVARITRERLDKR